MGLFNLFRKKETDVERYQKELNQRREPVSGEILLRVEDTFTIAKRGTVAVGKCEAPFCKGDTVQIQNSDGTCREATVEGLEKFRTIIDTAQPGDTVGVLLKGIGKTDILPGAVLKHI